MTPSSGWPCEAFQPVEPPFGLYRCSEPYGHPGLHQAVLDGEVIAEWALHQCLACPSGCWECTHEEENCECYTHNHPDDLN